MLKIVIRFLPLITLLEFNGLAGEPCFIGFPGKRLKKTSPFLQADIARVQLTDFLANAIFKMQLYTK